MSLARKLRHFLPKGEFSEASSLLAKFTISEIRRAKTGCVLTETGSNTGSGCRALRRAEARGERQDGVLRTETGWC